jgi:4,5-DOPA dioxygenase extradiol
MAIDTSYAKRFSDGVAQRLHERDTEALLDYRQQHPDAMQAQPRDEHLLPLFTALGAAGPEAHSRTVHRGISDHVIAVDSYAFERD